MMNQLFNNKYLKNYKFSSYNEALLFMNNLSLDNILKLDNNYDEYFYCYIAYHSLTQKKEFAIFFSNEEDKSNLNFMYWIEGKVMVLDTGSKIYLIDDKLNIKVDFNITTPLIGLYKINCDKLLILEEAFLRIINYEGKILKEETFDLIEDFKIENDNLYFETYDGSQIIQLNLSDGIDYQK